MIDLKIIEIYPERFDREEFVYDYLQPALVKIFFNLFLAVEILHWVRSIVW